MANKTDCLAERERDQPMWRDVWAHTHTTISGVRATVVAVATGGGWEIYGCGCVCRRVESTMRAIAGMN